MNDEGARNLVAGIVLQAVNDYRKALYKYNTARGRGNKFEHRNVIGECELFFRKNLEVYCSLNGEQIIRSVREDVRRQLEKKGITMEVPKF